MLSISRRKNGSPGDAPRRNKAALAVSLLVNAGLMVVFFQAVLQGYKWSDVFHPGRSKEITAERIGFVELPKANGGEVRGRSGGDGRPLSKKPATPPPQAPADVPSTLPPSDATAPAVDAGGTGPVVGNGGALEGIRPSYTDSRIWAPAGKGVRAPRSSQEQLDSVVADIFTGPRDSIRAAQALAAGQRGPGDWTVKGPGGKWGMDQSAIRLGKVSIPNALLALLSGDLQKNLRGNPIQMAEDRRLSAVRADLLQHAQREMTEDAFHQAVKEIRKRKDRERAERGAQQPKLAGTDAPAPANPDRK
jgi:hypothetical protein